MSVNLTEETSMPIQSHLAELERKHQALEDQINDAMAHPSSDDLTIAELKRSLPECNVLDWVTAESYAPD